MKSSRLLKGSHIWYKSFFALLVTIFVLVPSCQKEEFENEMVPTASFMNAVLKPSVNAIIYYGPETFRITSKNDPLVAIRTLTNPNFKYFGKFMIKVKNGNGNSNKDVILEILIDDVVVVTSSDFTKRKNIITKELTGLTPESVLEIRLEGGKNKSITLLIECSLQEDVITDIDGNYYKTVNIGDQWWMAENLRVTKFNDGTAIPNVTDDEEWEALMLNHLPAYCWYNNDPGYKDPYGGLYSRGAVESDKNVCPVGWHVPDGTDDWLVLFMYLDPEIEPWWMQHYIDTDIGNLLKEAGTSHWNCIENASTNETGFTALPGGKRRAGNPSFIRIGQTGTFWADRGYSFFTLGCGGNIEITEGGDDDGFSVRCVKD
jgi:uncharacterized protein (TIGR02145 family)